jgi:hypothetical protein
MLLKQGYCGHKRVYREHHCGAVAEAANFLVEAPEEIDEHPGDKKGHSVLACTHTPDHGKVATGA